MTLSEEWVPLEENAFADYLLKLLIPDDWKLAPKFFNLLEARWGLHTVDLFASSDNAQCKKFYSLHWCRGPAGVNDLWIGLWICGCVDWVWLPRDDPNLFIEGRAPGRMILPPNWPLMAVRVDFSQREGQSRRVLSKRDRCLQGGCKACRSNSWHRQE